MADGGAIASLLSEKCPGELGWRVPGGAIDPWLVHTRLFLPMLQYPLYALHKEHTPPLCTRPHLLTRCTWSTLLADAVSGWEGARAEDGTLPIDFARRTGLGGVVERFLAVKK